jgi:glutamine cyclotransferase
MKHLWLLAWMLALAACARADVLGRVPDLGYRITGKHAHDITLFTQGMAFWGEHLVESGGGYRQSRVLLRDLANPAPTLQVRLPAGWWGEGVAVLGDRAVVLTWREGVAQEFSLPALQRTRRFTYSGEGWGLATDGASLIQSDGSANIVWRSPRDFSEQHRLTVRAAGKPVERLNELEWVDGWLLANVWQTDAIVLIDPADGSVRGKLDLRGLLSSAEAARADVLNGIAWHAPTRTLWVSGKNWPWMFALEVQWPSRGQGKATGH